MDPFAALGLAANLVQFLEFSRKLITGAAEIYHAADGALSSNAVLEHLTEDLDQLCEGLELGAKDGGSLSTTKSEAELIPLAKSCRELGRELVTILQDLKAKGRRKTWASARQALRSVWRAKDIQNYEDQMNRYRTGIMSRLIVIIKKQQDLIIEEQSGTSRKMDELASTLDHLANSHRKLELSSSNIPAQIRENINRSLHDALKERNSKHSPLFFPHELHRNLLNLRSESISLQKQINIIESLQFSGIFERENSVKQAHPRTFEWLFKESDDASKPGKTLSILPWLRNGTKIFWISGKAGSGKSTLMKFFYYHEKTLSALQEWAGSRRLIVASFFFWNAGSTMQKSQHGLLQTILYHIFKQAPELIDAVCPSRWRQRVHSNEAWKHEEIKQVFVLLQKQRLDSIRFCFFVDGLDEYDGDHQDIISILDEFTSSGTFKICFSSRPWVVFERRYGDNAGFRTNLQDLTQGDIKRFAEEKLFEGAQSLMPNVHKEDYDGLVKEVVDKSDGVFLWVFLAVRSLRRGMTNLDTPGELRSRLQELPTELEAFFRLILNATEKAYHRQAARLYRICLVARCKISALDLAWFAEEEPNFGLSDEFLTITPDKFVALSQVTVTRINARCQDLLELTGANLQFLHRTVKDFLETKDISSELEVRSGVDFDPHRFLCNSMLLQMRLKAVHAEPNAVNFHRFSDHLIAFLAHLKLLRKQGQLEPRLVAEMVNSASNFYRTQGKSDLWPHVHISSFNHHFVELSVDGSDPLQQIYDFFHEIIVDDICQQQQAPDHRRSTPADERIHTKGEPHSTKMQSTAVCRKKRKRNLTDNGSNPKRLQLSLAERISRPQRDTES